MKRTRVPFVTRYKSSEISHIGGASKMIGAKCLEDYIKFAALKMADIIYHQEKQRQAEAASKLIKEKDNESLAKCAVQSKPEAATTSRDNQDTDGNE